MSDGDDDRAAQSEDVAELSVREEGKILCLPCALYHTAQPKVNGLKALALVRGNPFIKKSIAPFVNT